MTQNFEVQNFPLRNYLTKENGHLYKIESFCYLLNTFFFKFKVKYLFRSLQALHILINILIHANNFFNMSSLKSKH